MSSESVSAVSLPDEAQFVRDEAVRNQSSDRRWYISDIGSQAVVLTVDVKADESGVPPGSN
jgi:hypothetical protein